MSEAETVKKPRKKKFILIGLGLVVFGGGGVGAGLWAGIIGHHKSAAELNRPHLVAREGVSAADVERYSTRDGSGRPDPTKFNASYYPIKESFTANLRDSDSFIQVAIGVSTYYDDHVIQNITRHEMAVRSAVLMTLTNQDTLPMSTPQGKEALRGELKKAINATLKAKEGFGGIDDVYFTSFVVQ